jgi:hypothetical protein
MKTIMIELKYTDNPMWLGTISIFEKTGEKEYTALHVGIINHECYDKLKDLLGGTRNELNVNGIAMYCILCGKFVGHSSDKNIGAICRDCQSKKEKVSQ